MIKRWWGYYCAIAVLFIIPLANAGSIGISPASFSFYFEPSFEKTLQFKAFNSNPLQESEIYVKGDFAEYVNVSIKNFTGYAIFNVTIKLPEKIEVPGVHRIIIGARETRINQSKMEGGVGASAAIQAPIDIIVPYPGKYAEAKFVMNDVSLNEDAPFELELNNLGSEVITFFVDIEVFFGADKIHNKSFVIDNIDPKTQYILKNFINSSNFSAGIYDVKVKVDYGKIININKVFRIGQLFINITDYSYIFIENDINPFYIEIESLWNLPIKNVYSEVIITQNGTILRKFRPSFVDVKPFQKVNLTSFFDATNISEGRYTANLNVYYEDKITQKLAAIYVNKVSENKFWQYMILTFIFTAIFIMTIFIIIIIYLLLKIRRFKNQKNS